MPSNPNMRNEKLRGVLEGLGFDNVASVISSGNLIFDGDGELEEMEARIEAAWPKQLGFESSTTLRSLADLERLIAANPFGEREDVPASRLHVTFLKRDTDVELELPHHGPAGGYEILTIEDRAIFTVVNTTDGPRTSAMMRWLEQTFGKEITTRTWKTVHRIAKRMAA